jgi:hypothetical protein
MALTSQQKHDLFLVARKHWIEAEATIYAYAREYQRHRRNSDWFKRGTLVAAGLTALSAPFNGVKALTVTTGVLTALLTACEQAYAPTSNAQRSWACRQQLHAIKDDLVNCAMAVDLADDLTSGVEPFTAIGQRIADVTKDVPFQTLPADTASADQAFKTTVIAGLIVRIGPAASVRAPLETADDLPVGVPEDAPGLIAASGPRA